MMAVGCCFRGIVRRAGLFTILTIGSWGFQITAADALVMRADRGTTAEEVVLSWTGGSPEFQVYRSNVPMAVVDPANQIANTRDYEHSDVLPASVWFYRVGHTADCIVVAADTFVLDVFPTTPNGTDTHLEVVSYPNLTTETLLRFELGSIPEGARIVSADLELDSASAIMANRIDARAALTPWDEATVTWDSRPAASAPYAQIVHDGFAGWKTWNITALVQDWVDGALENEGLVMAGPVQFVADVYYRSREEGAESAPRLCVNWMSATNAAIEALTAESDPAHRNVFDFDQGMTTWIDVRVPIGETFAGDVVLQAQDFLIRHKDVWGLRDPQAELYLDRVVVDAEEASVFFGQRIGNVPVYASALSVYIEKDVIVGAQGRYIPDAPEQPPSAILSPEEAEEVAFSHLGLLEGQVATETEFMAYAEGLVTGESVALTSAWRVTPAGAQNGIKQRFDVYVDAINGDILYAASQDYEAHPSGEDFDIETANGTSSDTCWLLPWETADDQWYDESGPDGYPGAGSDPAGDGPEMFDLTHLANDYYWDRHGRRSWDARMAQVESMIYADVPNAAYSRGCDHMKFREDYITDDIVGHEYTHGVVYHSANLVYRNNPGALNESFADVFGEFIDRTPEWLHGEDLPTGPNRSLENPPDEGQPDHLVDLCTRGNNYCGWGSDNEGVHTNSGIPNKVAYLLVNGGRHNGIDVFSIGLGKVEKLYFYTLIRKVSSNTHFNGARRLFIHVARVWAQEHKNGFGLVDACAVINAWASVGLSDPDADCDGYPDEIGSDGDNDGVPYGTDTCPTVYNPDQHDIDGDGLGDDCDGDDDGDGFDDGRDNCPTVANPGQENTDTLDPGDACQDVDQDGIIDAIDNCPTNTNPDQTDTDGDGDGDACDTDDDNDGISDWLDRCPLRHDPSNIDSDSDLIGDYCDNCPVDYNPDQVNSDRDVLGNACDDDDDNDGIPDDDDNCPTRSNPQQIDANEDGVGLFCDAEEQQLLDGLRVEAELAVRFLVDPIALDPVVFPVFPCRGGETCPDWLGPDQGTTVYFETTSPVLARIVDDRGFVVGKDNDDDQVSTHNFEFMAQPELSYLSPGVDAGLPYTDSSAEQRFEQRHYYLEVRALPGAVAGEIEGIIRVSTTP